MKRPRRWTNAMSREWYALRRRSNPRSNANWNRTRGYRELARSCRFAFSKYIASVGTSVRDRMYDASMAKTTASAKGTKRYLATPAKSKDTRDFSESGWGNFEQ